MHYVSSLPPSVLYLPSSALLPLSSALRLPSSVIRLPSPARLQNVKIPLYNLILENIPILKQTETMAFTVRDHYFHKAKKEHFLARAIYKLEEIQKKYSILRPGNKVLDLGAAPGSWIQLAERSVGPSGLVLGIDLKPIEHNFPKHVITLQGDINDRDFVDSIIREKAPFDIVLSDMAPSTSGVKVADAARSALLFERALEIALGALRPGGIFLAKIFQGNEFHQLLAEVKKHFEKTRVVKPEASRKQSREIYILALNLRNK